MINLKCCLMLLIVLVFVSSAESQVQAISKQLSQNQWQQDIDKLFTKIRRLHPNPWRTVSEKKFRDHLQDIVKNSAGESKTQTIVKLTRAVAMLSDAGRDGQSRIWPMQKASDFHLLPIHLYWFSDGIYIVETDLDNNILNGQRLIAIAGQPIADVLEKVKPYVSHENALWLKRWIPLYALIPELLETLNISRGSSVEIKVVNKDNKVHTKRIKAVSVEAYDLTFSGVLNIASLPVSLTAPIYLQKIFEKKFWLNRITESSLYIQLNQIMSQDEDEELFSNFIDQVEIEIKKYQLTSIIVDLRNNPSEDIRSYQPFLEMLNNFKTANKALDLYVLIGRGTFSEAVNLSVDLDNKVSTLFIGEETGASPDRYSDTKTIILPNSNLIVELATRFRNKTATNNKSLTLKPDFLVELSSMAYFSKQDPVLKKALDLIELKSFE